MSPFEFWTVFISLDETTCWKTALTPDRRLLRREMSAWSDLHADAVQSAFTSASSQSKSSLHWDQFPSHAAVVVVTQKEESLKSIVLHL